MASQNVSTLFNTDPSGKIKYCGLFARYAPIIGKDESCWASVT